MFWDEQYRKKGRVWGDRPSELAKVAFQYLQGHMPNQELNILDIGCGYGRDALYLSKNANWRILGIDVSEEAVGIASRTALESGTENVEFEHQDFRELQGGECDIILSSNVYQILRTDERKEFRETIARILNPSGLLFFSTLSARDPEHSGKGTPLTGEPNSYQDVVYLHLCTREELGKDFYFLKIEELYEHRYDEPRVTGEIHHHISWILIGQKQGI